MLWITAYWIFVSLGEHGLGFKISLAFNFIDSRGDMAMVGARYLFVWEPD